MKSISFILGMIVLLTMSCKNTLKLESMNSNEASQWFKNGKWRVGLPSSPDESVDVNEFYKQFKKNPNIWEKAFDYFKSTDLQKIEPGKYVLIEDSLFVIIDEYVTKDEKNARFEAHRKFADIQYLISGEEQIGVQALAKAEKVLQDYDETKDIGFYEISENNYRKADQKVFFVFFPDDAHKPCVKKETNTMVKKIVFKIIVND